VIVEEMKSRGGKGGEYREVRDVLFTPEGLRTEQSVGKPVMTLQRLRLTEEDFRDVREVQSLLFTKDTFWAYETEAKGEEQMDGIDCYVLKVRPRQILQGQRLFDGLFWVDKTDYSIVRSEGQAVPQMRSARPVKENLFPHFTTIREKINGYWFPVTTYGDDLLDFSNGPIRMRLIIRYRDYKRFTAESRVIAQ
jgi:hypothetical protein